MKLFLDLIAIGVAGSLGALTRYGITRYCVSNLGEKFPYGTFVANMTGCLLIGIAVGSSFASLSPRMKLAVGVGFLGSLTTFSTFASESVLAAEGNAMPVAVGNVIANVAVGIMLVCAGLWIGRKMSGQ